MHKWTCTIKEQMRVEILRFYTWLSCRGSFVLVKKQLHLINVTNYPRYVSVVLSTVLLHLFVEEIYAFRSWAFTFKKKMPLFSNSTKILFINREDTLFSFCNTPFQLQRCKTYYLSTHSCQLCYECGRIRFS